MESNILKDVIADFTDKDVKKSLTTKISNVNKALSKGVPLCTARVASNSRQAMPLADVLMNNLQLNHLSSYSYGIVIYLQFEEYEQLDIKQDKSEIEKYIVDNIGSDNLVSSIVVMTNQGDSNANSVRSDALCRFKNLILKNNWEKLQIIKAKKNTHKFNHNWKGHYYYNLCGGNNKSNKSHEKDIAIFTPSINGFANKAVCTHVQLTLLWQFLHCVDIHNYLSRDNILKAKTRIENVLNSTFYFGQSISALMKNLNNIHDGVLMSPIRIEKLKVMDLLNEGHISHDVPASKHTFLYCTYNKCVLSDYRPGNLFWDTKRANQQQGDFTIKEYWEDLDRSFQMRQMYVH